MLSEKNNTPQFGLLTNPTIPVPKEIVRFAKLGFDYVEISIEEPAATPQILMKQKNRILKLLAKHKIFAIGHTAYWVHFGTSHEKARRGWIEEAKDMIRTASELKIRLLNFHFYGKLGQIGVTRAGRNKFLKNFSNSMNELVRFAKTHNVTLMLENVPTEDSGMNSIDDFLFVMKKVPELKFHLDVAHAFIEGGMKRIEDYMRTFEKRLIHVHIHDNHGLEDEHLPIGAGTIEFEKVVSWLKEINYDKTVTIEVFTSYNDAVHSRAILEEFWD